MDVAAWPKKTRDLWIGETAVFSCFSYKQQSVYHTHTHCWLPGNCHLVSLVVNNERTISYPSFPSFFDAVICLFSNALMSLVKIDTNSRSRENKSRQAKCPCTRDAYTQ